MTLFYLAVAYIAGVVLGRLAWGAGFLGCSMSDWWWIAPLALLPFTPLLNRLVPDRSAPVALRWPVSAGFTPPRHGWSAGLWAAIGLCLAAGALRYAVHPLAPCWTPADLATWNLPANKSSDRNAPQVTLEGYVASYPLVDDTRQRLDIAAERLIADGAVHPVQGTARLWTSAAVPYAYGQPVHVTGRLVTPPELGEASYREYLARQGIYSTVAAARVMVVEGPWRGSWMRRQLYGLRGRGARVIERALAEPYAALAKGILLGMDAGIPDDLYEAFNRTGTSHILVISGSNMALVAGALLAVSGRVLGRRRAVIPALLGITAYAALVGAEAPVLRAALMAGLVVVATGLGRRSAALVSLAVAAWAMTLANPVTLWDVGFQLSVAATTGLILFAPGLSALLVRWRPGAGSADSVRGLAAGLMEDGLVISLAATVLVLPLVAYHFGRVSVLSVPANLLIVPVQPLILTWGSGGVLAGVAGIAPLAQAMLWGAWLGLFWTTQAVERLAALPWASVEVGRYGLPALVVTYAAILAAYAGRRLVARMRPAVVHALSVNWQEWLVAPAALGGLAVAALLVWGAALSQPDGRLHVHFLDVGQGDGVLIQTPSGRQVLVDGGSSPQALFSELGAVMPFWDRSLDLMVATHADADHVAAQVELPQRLKVEQAMETMAMAEDPEAAIWQERMDAANTEVTLQGAGGWMDLGDGVALWVLWPEPGAVDMGGNEASLVLKLVYGKFSVLLTGDAGEASEAAWVAQGVPLQATVLKVGHHGSDGSTGAALVTAVDPRIAVIQVGAENRYGHPSAEVMDRLAGRTVFRTDVDGRVHVYSDGTQMWVETETGR